MAYGNFLPKRFLAIPRRGTLNVHPSLLPRWRGAAPVPRAIEAGDDVVGVSLVYTVLKMDAGELRRVTACDLRAQGQQGAAWRLACGRPMHCSVHP